jgi:hypothetical protein
MSKSWPLLVFVSLKYCGEKRLLKTHVALFMEVTVCITPSPTNVVNVRVESHVLRQTFDVQNQKYFCCRHWIMFLQKRRFIFWLGYFSESDGLFIYFWHFFTNAFGVNHFHQFIVLQWTQNSNGFQASSSLPASFSLQTVSE